jgi:hypothetical protein
MQRYNGSDVGKCILSFIAFISFKLKRLNMKTITKLTITSHLFNQSIGILGNRIKKIPPTLIYNLNDRTVEGSIKKRRQKCGLSFKKIDGAKTNYTSQDGIFRNKIDLS